jgi:hypothetical protein
MNLFRSEEHVKNWGLYDPISEESIMPVADWAQVFSGPLVRTRFEPDCLSHVQEYMGDLLGRIAKLGRTGPFWTPAQK